MLVYSANQGKYTLKITEKRTVLIHSKKILPPYISMQPLFLPRVFRANLAI
jgi:hypothetical protein